jgi:putative SOS response-associated peptidase YedK
MCYSAEVEEDWRRFLRVTGADMSLKDFYNTYWKRRSGLPFRMPRMLERWFDDVPGDDAAEIRKLNAEWNAEQIAKFEQQAFASRKRIADGERALQVKVTKKAQDDVRIGNNKLQQAKDKLDFMKGIEPDPDYARIFPGWYAPVVVVQDGKRVVKPMRYQLRRAGQRATDDEKYPGCYNARRDNLERFWKGQFGYTHGITVARRFYENVERGGKNAILEFTPNGLEDMIVACLYSRWIGDDGEELLSFAAITDEPPAEVAAAGHDRCIIPIKPEHIDAWLNPDPLGLPALYAILDDRERPYYEHRLAA